MQHFFFFVLYLGYEEIIMNPIISAAFSIHSLEEAGLLNLQKMKESPKFPRTKTVREKEGKVSRQPSHGN